MFSTKAQFEAKASTAFALGLLFSAVIHWSLLPLTLMATGAITLRRGRKFAVALSSLVIGATMLTATSGYLLGKQLALRDNLLESRAMQQAR
ncbi:hypothetical protein [Stenotrophomonas sp. Iso1]|uniref:hypothetical protein n=1 Tax=Stenotrophomonas sp. Iso1 TaxID=2977283 RepID=UPI0022B7B3F5|nr:hypothetical protein [Stenotrophomonas sp. Iso1]